MIVALSLMNQELATRVGQASTALFGAVCQAIADERGTHLETALTAAGYLAGNAMLVGTGVDLSGLEPGSYVIVEQVNEIGPMVFDAVFTLVQRGGVDASTGAVKSVPPEHAALKPFEELLPLVLPVFAQVNRQFEIPTEMQPFVAARTCAEIILAGRDQVHPAILKAIAAEAIMKAAKTVAPR
jgi:hypothetical protein